MPRYFWAMVLGLLMASGVHAADNKKPAPAPKPGGGNNTNKNNNNNNNKNNNNANLQRQMQQMQQQMQQAYLQSQFPSALSGMMGSPNGAGGYGSGGMGGYGMGGGRGGNGRNNNNGMMAAMMMMNMMNRMNQMGNGSGFTDMTISTDSDTAWRVANAPKDASAEDKKAMKGDDPKQPGYTGTNDDLKVGQTVRITRARKRTPDPNKPDEVRYYTLPEIYGTVQKIDGSSQFVCRVQTPPTLGAIPYGRNNRQQQPQQQNRQPQPADPEVTVTRVYMYNKVADAEKVTKSE